MKRVSLLALALVAGAPAHAADLATLGCVADKLDDKVREQIAKDAERNLTGAAAATSDPGVTAALRDGAVACAKENGWSQAALRPAANYTRAKLGWPTAQRIAAEKGLDPAVLETVWLTLPEEQRNAPLAIDAYRQLADAAIPEGEQRTEEMGRFVSRFFQFLSIIQYASYDFAQA